VGKATSAISKSQKAPLLWGEDTHFAAEVEQHPVCVQHRAHYVGVTAGSVNSGGLQEPRSSRCAGKLTGRSNIEVAQDLQVGTLAANLRQEPVVAGCPYDIDKAVCSSL
jgi:hypothetical protein